MKFNICVGILLCVCFSTYSCSTSVFAQNTTGNYHPNGNNFKYLYKSTDGKLAIVKKFLKQRKTNDFYGLPNKVKEQHLSKALKVAKSLKEQSFYVKVFDEMSEFKRDIGDLKSAEILSRKAIHLAETYNVSDVFVESHDRLAFIEKRRGNLRQAMNHAEKALKKAKSVNDKLEVIDCLQMISNLRQKMNQLYKAQENSIKALKIAKELKKPHELANIYTRLGKIYLRVRENKKALNHRLKALKFAKISGDSSVIIKTKHRLGDVYTQIGSYKKALPLYETALKYRKKYARRDRYAQVLVSIGLLYSKKDQPEKVLKYFKRAVPHFKSMNHSTALSFIYSKIGKSFLELGKLDSARISYKKSLELINNQKRFKSFSSVYKGLSEVEAKQENYLKAYKYLNLHKAAYDSMQFAKQNRLTAYNEAKFEYTIKQNKQEAAFDAALNLKEQQIEYRNYLIAGFIIISVIISVLLYLLYRSRERQKESLAIIRNQNKDIQQKNESLKELNEIKNNYFTILAHDLRTPFSTILQLSEVANKYTEEKELSDFREVTTLLEKSSIQFNKLLESTLEWGRLQMNGIMVNKERLNLNDEINRTLKFVGPSANIKEISLSNNISENIAVYSDKDILQGVTNNLVTNAIKFTNKGGEVNVSASVDNSKVKVFVVDNGIGISDENLETIFTPGNHLSKNGTQGEKGSGFGLINSKKMIELNGGELSIESTEGEGTTVHFTLELSR